MTISFSAEYLRSILGYDPETGVFVWKYRPDKTNQINSRDAGRVAGSNKAASGAYTCICVDEVLYLAHRLAWLYMTGEWPRENIDHIDGNGFNNKWENLREATQKENCYNRKKAVNCTSGYKGVSYHKQSKKWVATISINGRKKHIGIYLSPEDAYLAYCAFAEKHHGEFARVA